MIRASPTTSNSPTRDFGLEEQREVGMEDLDKKEVGKDHAIKREC
jgi:hypothetical protein